MSVVIRLTLVHEDRPDPLQRKWMLNRTTHAFLTPLIAKLLENRPNQDK